jgi:protein transport protein SEC24
MVRLFDLGERRIRVITLALPVTSSMSDIFSNADQIAIASVLAKKAVERSITSKIEDAREALFYKLTEILAQYKTAFNQSTHSAQLLICDNLKLLPILILGLIKNVFLSNSRWRSEQHLRSLQICERTC